ncbi:flagellar biosynthesis protein FlhF [Nitrospirillum amazonense]|uniref:Flagellar biosynthesis protein FlhF n=1 Tax=Nitrospirillum amazonense TaxID=28077 RepID=A0A560F528_9PROT|nr:GTPase [Nitrospirillum amazonense]TWB16645.1 flagellar biosynthesis protein FlhF [Nitrospirillum amazonense]
MRLKSFHAPTMGEAMRLVREVLGDDAIIVATREEEGVGVRVTAAVEESIPVPGMPAINDRYHDPLAPDPADQVTDILFRHGLPADLNQRLMDSIADFDAKDAQTLLAAALESVFTFQPLPEGRFPKPLMLVGPPGAGKTLTVAKLCARAALKGRPVGVISTDTVRAGGIDQLAAFTRVLKLRLMTVEDPLALADALDVQRGAEQVLVDSAGRNPYSQADLNDLRDFLVAADIEPVLVLPAGMDPVEASEMARAFRALGARRLLTTRLDMARRLGSMLTAAHEAGLALCDASTSPRAAEGLTPLSPTSLARLMMPGSETSERRAKQTGTHA